MIQRIQSLYLLLTTILSALLFYIPLFEFQAAANETVPRMFMLSTSPLLLILDMAIGVLAFIAIFFYKKRRLQIRACRLLLLLIFIMVGLFFFTSDTLASGADQRVTFKAGAYLPLIQIVFVFLAQRAIKKDDELVRSADRLR